MANTYSAALSLLKQKQFSAIVRSPEYKMLLSNMVRDIREHAKSAPNEATIESYFDCRLFSLFNDVFSHLGYKYEPIKEASIVTNRHITKGRADTAIGGLIIEFKQPSTLLSKEQQNNAVNQISDYLCGYKDATSLVGFITDGLKGCFVYKDNGEILCEDFSTLSAEQLDRLIQYIIKSRLTALSSQSLVSDFCNHDGIEGKGISLAKVLYLDLSRNITPRTEMLFNEWKELFNLSHDDTSKQTAIEQRRLAIESLFGLSFSVRDEEYKALFALQTAYIIIVKLVAFRILSLVRFRESLIDFENLYYTDNNALQVQLLSLEEGSIFRQYGITNLLEGDFFSWYIYPDQWTSNIANGIKGIFNVLLCYTTRPVLNSLQKSADFFKELYQGMMPSAVRHSLGEYYTRKWLAKQVIEEALDIYGTSNWRGLDPCCGSGTFITAMIDKVLDETVSLGNEERLKSILNRVVGIDLNPVAVLTARVNYFINILPFIGNEAQIEIPIYLGDSSFVPKRTLCDNIPCLEYSIKTLKEPINILVPYSLVENSQAFSKAMTEIEFFIKNLDEEGAYNCIAQLIPNEHLTHSIKTNLHNLTSSLVQLERDNWDGIWARIITNFLTTANLGKFDIIAGNPPWVDWKNLPSGYRERLISLCISRSLFSGDSVTGGINLNICALITNVVCENWLSQSGVLAFLMPEPLIFQPSYEGFRNLIISDNRKLYFQKLTNWTKSGHPFKPVTQKFLTFFISSKFQNYSTGIPVEIPTLNVRTLPQSESLDFNSIFTIDHSIAGTCHSERNNFTYASNEMQLRDFSLIAKKCSYIGREGIEFYPQEMMLFTLSSLPSTSNCTSLRNIQVQKSKYKVPQFDVLLETKFLHPLIKGTDIQPFHVEISDIIVPFPYDERDYRLPIPMNELALEAPKLALYYQRFRDLILAQTSYNERIIGKKGEFYALARVGKYSFAPHYVVFRDNTKWGAAVISEIETSWGGFVRPQFQNHAVSISEDRDGNYISLDEAHFICGILNTDIAHQYVIKSSDARSFPVDPRVYIPKFDATNQLHMDIVALSKEAHIQYNNPIKLQKIIDRINTIYLQIALSDS